MFIEVQIYKGDKNMKTWICLWLADGRKLAFDKVEDCGKYYLCDEFKIIYKYEVKMIQTIG